MVTLKGNFCLIKPDPVEEKIGSFYLPEEYRKNQQQTGVFGTIVAMGDGTWVERFYVDREEAEKQLDEVKVHRRFEKRPIDENIQIGTRVVYPRYVGMEIEIKGEKYLMVKEYDILGVVEE